MWIDARSIPEGQELDTDICIVGAGPAGLTLARELAGRNIRVCLLESGGRELSEENQDLADGKFTGAAHFEQLRNARRRQLGGMANQWDSEIGIPGKLGFRAGPLDAVDFEQRDWLPYSGWPFGRSHLDPFYKRVHETFGLGPYRYDGSSWSNASAPLLALDPSLFETDVWTFVRQEIFTRELPEALAHDANISVVLWANVIEVDTDENARRVTGVQVACLNGNRFRVKAQQFILAAGGMENARLLLLSDRVQRGGLGNGKGVVGRFFTEHQPVNGGTLFPRDRAIIDALALYDVRTVDGVPVIGKFRLKDEILRQEHLLGFSVALLPKHKRYKRARGEYTDSLAILGRSLARFRWPANGASHLRNVYRGADYIAARLLKKASGGRLFADFNAGPDMLTGGGWSKQGIPSQRYSVVDVHFHVEQAPHPENRIMLSGARDPLGCRKTHLHWLWRERDIDSVRRAQRIVADGFHRANIGEYRILEVDGRPELEASGLHHHMGTTRMHDDVNYGVVDADSKVHGIANLFVAGYSVFPTGGYMNPTLTLLALAIRLGDHLKELMDHSGTIATAIALDSAKNKAPDVARTGGQ